MYPTKQAQIEALTRQVADQLDEIAGLLRRIDALEGSEIDPADDGNDIGGNLPSDGGSEPPVLPVLNPQGGVPAKRGPGRPRKEPVNG